MLCIMHFGRKSRIGEAPGRWSEWCRLLSLLSMKGWGGGHIQYLFTAWAYMYCTIRPTSHYTPHECFNMANQNSWKVGIFGRMLEGSHSHEIYCYFDQYQRK